MRREHLFRMPEREALGLLERSPAVHVAMVARDGQPILRTLHHAVVDGTLYFHSAPTGEKVQAVGGPAVASAEETIASIPSYFMDPERACPATTLYESVQVHGVLEHVEEPEAKARALAALMAKLQPEGGHVPITASHPLYRGPVGGLLVTRLRATRIDGKAKLAQNRSAEDRVRLLDALWKRGGEGDARAIEKILDANPGTPTPQFLSAPAGLRLHCHLKATHLDAAVSLIADEYWNIGVARERLARSLLGATAWVGATDANGRLVAQARALSDGAKCAWLYDVVTAPDWRGKGVGRAMVRMLLDHPAVRRVRAVWLGTKDAQALYRKFGFVLRAEAPKKPYATDDMVLLR